MFVFLCPELARQIQRPILLFSSETAVNPRKAEKCAHLIQLDVRTPLVVSVSERSEELRLCNLV
jgi:hypothetical protein